MTPADSISLARGAPSLDIVAVDDLRAAADAAFTKDPAGAFSYGTSAGYKPLVEWIAEPPGRGARAGDRHQRLDAGRRVPVQRAGAARRPGGGRGPELRPHAAGPAPAGRRVPGHPAGGRRHRRGRAGERARGRRAAEAGPHHPQLPQPRRLHALAREAREAGGPGRAVRLRAVRGRPVRGAALRGRVRAHDAVAGHLRPRGLRLVVLEDGLPRHPRGLPGGPGSS